MRTIPPPRDPSDWARPVDITYTPALPFFRFYIVRSTATADLTQTTTTTMPPRRQAGRTTTPPPTEEIDNTVDTPESQRDTRDSNSYEALEQRTQLLADQLSALKASLDHTRQEFPDPHELSDTDERFWFETYQDGTIDDITKANARLTWEAYEKQHPGAQPEEHFQCLVQWGAQQKPPMSMKTFCALASTMYGPATKFLYQSSTAYRTPAHFFNECINQGDNVKPAGDLRKELNKLQYDFKYAGNLDDYISRFFKLIGYISRHATGKLYKDNHPAVMVEFLRGFSRTFRAAIDELVEPADLVNMRSLLTFITGLWGKEHNKRFDSKPTPHETTKVTSHHAGKQQQASKRKEPDPLYIALSQEDRNTLKDIHKVIGDADKSLTKDHLAFLTRVGACHLCGTLQHTTADCTKSTKRPRAGAPSA